MNNPLDLTSGHDNPDSSSDDHYTTITFCENIPIKLFPIIKNLRVDPTNVPESFP
jgi:hypothetical protein